MQATLSAIEYHLPEQVLSNRELAQVFSGWKESGIFAKTGITERRISAEGERSSDLAFQAASKLLSSGQVQPTEVEALLLCTQSPDYLLPTTACLLQDRLGLPTHIAALDFNLGCSGFVYGLSLAKGLIETGQVRNVLLITAETYSKYLHPQDKSVRTLFGDGAAAAWITGVDSDQELIGPFVFGTDGSGAEHLILRTDPDKPAAPSSGYLYMNGPEIFRFTLETVPACVHGLCQRASVPLEAVDLFVFHQANAYMLEHLREKIGIPAEKFFVFLESCGNTVSSTIPIALKEAADSGRLRPGMQVMLVGFGVGLSWAATLIRWAP